MYSAFGVEHGSEPIDKAWNPLPKIKSAINRKPPGGQTQSAAGPTPSAPTLGQRMKSMNPVPRIKSAFARKPPANQAQPPATTPPGAPPSPGNTAPDINKTPDTEKNPWERMNESMKQKPGAWLAGGAATGVVGGSGVTYLSTRRR